MDSDTEEKRGRKRRSERARMRWLWWRQRERNPMLAHSHTSFFLPLAVFCLWYLTLQQWDPSKQRVTPTFPLLRERSSLSRFLPLWEDSRQTTSQSKTVFTPFAFSSRLLDGGRLLMKITLHFEDSIQLITTFLGWISELLQMWLNWNSRLLSCGLEVPPWCFPPLFSSCGPEVILFLFFSSHDTMFARIFVPKKHRQRFDEAVSQNVINRLCRSKSISEPQGRIRRSRSEDHSDRSRSSKRASSVPRDGEQGGRSDDRSARKSVSGISVHPPIGPHQRWAHRKCFQLIQHLLDLCPKAAPQIHPVLHLRPTACWVHG